MVENLYDFLKKEHQEVKELFRMTLDHKNQSYFSKIQNELGLHIESEELYLYPLLVDVNKVKLYEAYEEHNVAKRLISEITEESNDERWFAKTGVLKEIIHHHIKEEERDIFDIAKKILTKEQEREILSKFKERKISLE